MKKIKLINLKLTNFKGIKEFDLKANGHDLSIYGKNASGKTTIKDAFNWVLFDKDSQNRNTNGFNIKTIIDGKPVSKLNHEVELTLQIDDNTLVLKKIYKELWKKISGAPEATFSGHTTDHYINEVPSKKKEYDEKVSEIIDEESFRLLTDPEYFNNLHWKDRRDVVIELAGDITDEEVASNDKDLKELLSALNGNSIDDHKKIIAAKRNDINNEIEQIPVRVDEINRNLPDTTKLNKESIDNNVKELEAQIQAKNEQINNIKNGSEVVEIKKQISELETELNKVVSNHEDEQKQELYKLETRLSEEQTNLDLMRGKIRPLIQDKESIERDVETKNEQMNILREDFKVLTEKIEKENAKEFDEHAATCPTCSQELPKENIDKMIAEFNERKSRMLEGLEEDRQSINPKGKKLKTEVEKLEEEIESINKEIDKLTKDGEKKAADVEKLQKSIDKAKNEVVEVTENEKYIELNKQITDLKEQSMKINESAESEINTVKEEIAEIETDKNKLTNDLNKLKQVEDSKVRVKELEAEERNYAKQLEELAKQQHLTEVFTRKKINMLNDKINNKFEYARFNLFKETIKGGLIEVCETTYKGVPFESNLNTGHKALIGLDIIKTLSKHYQVEAPIVFDNFEAITLDLETDAQLIKLIVSKEDEDLRIEFDEVKEVS